MSKLKMWPAKKFDVKNKKYHNLNETISTCDDSVWKIYRIFVRIFLVIYLGNINYTKTKIIIT